jgi:tetratricopeptide (TPR) repeat protein
MQPILILTALNLIVYFRLLRCGYIIDDAFIPAKKGKNFFHTLWLQISAKGYTNPAVEHLTRIIIHTAAAILIFFTFGRNEISFFLALLWSINPVNNMGVCWLNGVGYSMTTILILLMYLLPKFSWVFYFFTLWWHVTGFPAPLMFLLGPHPWLALNLLVYPATGILTGWQIPFGKVQNNATIAQRMTLKGEQNKRVYLKKLIFVIKMYGYYFWLTLFPKRLGLYHSFGFSFGITPEDTREWLRKSPFFFFSLATLAANLYFIFSFWGTPLSYGLIWFSIFIAPWCNFIILHQTVSERYCYLPSIGLLYALVWSIFQIPEATTKYSLLWGLAVFYVTKLSYYLMAYKSMENYVEYNLMEMPDQFAAWNWKGILEREKGRLFSSVYAFALGLRHKPNDFRLNMNMAYAMKFLGLYDQAEHYLKAAKEGMPPEMLADNLKQMEEEEKELKLRAGLQGKTKILPLEKHDPMRLKKYKT